MIRVVIIESKYLETLVTAIGIAKYRAGCENTKILGFTTTGVFRKKYIAILTGNHGDLARMIMYVRERKESMKAHYDNFIEKDSQLLGEWKLDKDLEVKKGE